MGGSRHTWTWRGVIVLALMGSVLACARPRPALEGKSRWSAGQASYFSASAQLRGMLLDLDAAGLPDRDRQALERVIVAELQDGGMQVLRENMIDDFGDATRRAGLVRDGSAEDLARLARRFGADYVLGGWVEAVAKGAWAWDIRMVNPEGRVIARAAGLVRGTVDNLYVAARKSAQYLLLDDPPTIDGAFTEADLDRALKLRRGFFDACLAEYGRKGHTGLSGQVRVNVRIEPDGRVVDAEARGSTFGVPGVGRCLEDAAMALYFPVGANRSVTLGYWVELKDRRTGAKMQLPDEGENPLEGIGDL